MAGRGVEAGRFTEYLEALWRAVGHLDRREPLRAYLTGLLLPGERKSVEPIAAKIDPHHVRARHQSMLHLVAEAPWDDHAVLHTAREWALPQHRDPRRADHFIHAMRSHEFHPRQLCSGDSSRVSSALPAFGS